jgi:hypothetical protein
MSKSVLYPALTVKLPLTKPIFYPRLCLHRENRTNLRQHAEPSASIHEGQQLVRFANGFRYTIIVTHHDPAT